MPEPEIPLIAAYQPDKTLIVRQGENISQRQFLQGAVALSQRLPAGGYTVNLCRDRYYFMLGFCASLLRASASLLPPNRQGDTIRDIVSRYPDSVCIVDCDEQPGPVTIDAREGFTATDEPELPWISSDQLAAVAFTSGSTGAPLAIEKRWFTLCGTAAMLARRFAPGDLPPPLIVATVPSQHMYGLEMTVMMALQGGCAIDAGHPFYAGEVAATLSGGSAPRMLVTTPVHLRHLLASDVAMPGVARLVSATAPLDADTARAAESLFGGKVEEIFGCTEAGSIATRRSVQEESWSLLDGMSIVRVEDQVRVSGPQLSAATPLQDRVELLGANRFRFLGRAADMINVGGKRASLAELTRKLQAIDGVCDAMVFLPAGDGIERPAALVVSSRSERELMRELARCLDPVLLPRPLRKVSAIPRNETGKAPVHLLQEALERRDEP